MQKLHCTDIKPLSATHLYGNAPVSMPPVIHMTVEVFSTQATLLHDYSA
jgi:hypothetical protein